MANSDLVAGLRRVGARLSRLPRGFYAALAAFWIGMIWYLSEQRMDAVPGGPIWRFLGNGVHVPLYGLLGLWAALALPRRDGDRWPRLTARAGLGIVGFVTLSGLVDEWHQSFTGRTSSAEDLLTDAVAATWVVIVATYAGRAGATPAGARTRLWGGVAACLAAVAVATF